MDLQLLASLLYQEESEALDFKVQQYAFSGATDEQKSELLKDILAFANAWRQVDAHILVGIEEVRAHRSIVRGIDPKDHLFNQELQQFVHSKTNRPVDFSYKPVHFEGVDIGVLTISLQERPIYLKKAYGKLAAAAVYIRRGDTTGIAAPEEVAEMGKAALLREMQPVLEVEFANPSLREKLGTALAVGSTVVEIPERSKIPLYGPDPHPMIGVHLDTASAFRNRDFYRDVATYIQDRSLLFPVGLAVTNPSATVAENVWVTLEFDALPNLLLADESSTPSEPSTETITSFRSGILQRDQHVQVAKYGNKYEIKAQIGTVQPGTTQWTKDQFYVGASSPMAVKAQIRISANNLRAPITLGAQITIEVKHVRMGVRDIKNLLKGAESE